MSMSKGPVHPLSRTPASSMKDKNSTATGLSAARRSRFTKTQSLNNDTPLMSIDSRRTTSKVQTNMAARKKNDYNQSASRLTGHQAMTKSAIMKQRTPPSDVNNNSYVPISRSSTAAKSNLQERFSSTHQIQKRTHSIGSRPPPSSSSSARVLSDKSFLRRSYDVGLNRIGKKSFPSPQHQSSREDGDADDDNLFMKDDACSKLIRRSFDQAINKIGQGSSIHSKKTPVSRKLPTVPIRHAPKTPQSDNGSGSEGRRSFTSKFDSSSDLELLKDSNQKDEFEVHYVDHMQSVENSERESLSSHDNQNSLSPPCLPHRRISTNSYFARLPNTTSKEKMMEGEYDGEISLVGRKGEQTLHNVLNNLQATFEKDINKNRILMKDCQNENDSSFETPPTNSHRVSLSQTHNARRNSVDRKPPASADSVHSVNSSSSVRRRKTSNLRPFNHFRNDREINLDDSESNHASPASFVNSFETYSDVGSRYERSYSDREDDFTPESRQRALSFTPISRRDDVAYYGGAPTTMSDTGGHQFSPASTGSDSAIVDDLSRYLKMSKKLISYNKPVQRTSSYTEDSQFTRPSLKQLIDTCRMITVKIDGSHDARILTDNFGLSLFETNYLSTNEGHIIQGRKPILNCQSNVKGGAFQPLHSDNASPVSQRESIIAIDTMIGRAQRSGKLKIGDYIIEVNGRFVLNESLQRIRELISKDANTLILVIARSVEGFDSVKDYCDNEIKKQFEKLQLKYATQMSINESSQDTIAELKLRIRDLEDNCCDTQSLRKELTEEKLNVKSLRDKISTLSSSTTSNGHAYNHSGHTYNSSNHIHHQNNEYLQQLRLMNMDEIMDSGQAVISEV